MNTPCRPNGPGRFRAIWTVSLITGQSNLFVCRLGIENSRSFQKKNSIGARYDRRTVYHGSSLGPVCFAPRLQVIAGIRLIEGLVAEGEIRDDVFQHGVL